MTEDIPLSTLEAKLLESDSEKETMEEVMAQIKKQLPAIQAGERDVELYEEMIVFASEHVSNAQVHHL